MDNSSLEYTTIKASSVVDAVKEWITDQLIKGNIVPGGKLPTEAELRINLGASRNSVREAIKQLEAQGVLYIRRAEGTFVSEDFEPQMLSPILYGLILQSNSWSDFVDLRRAIDIGTLYVLMGKELSEERIKCLADALHMLESAVNNDALETKNITKADCDFHNIIISLTANPQLITLSEYINKITIPSREKTTEAVIAKGQIASYIHLHKQLYDVIVNKDKSGIEQAVLNHYVFWEPYVGG